MTSRDAADFTLGDTLIFSSSTVRPADVVVTSSGNAFNITTLTVSGRSLSFSGAAIRSADILFVSSFIAGTGSTLHLGDDLNNNQSITDEGDGNVLQGLGGNDVLNGGSGADWLSGGNGADTLFGGDGNDVLDGGGTEQPPGFGQDVMTGGAGKDIFVIGPRGYQTIVDFTPGEDRLDVSRFAITRLDELNNSVSQDGADTVLQLQGSQGSLTLKLSGVEANDLFDARNFTFGIGRSITGTSGDNSLSGGEGNDTISGLAGNDTLNGFAGDDRLIGGTGNDALIVDSPQDVVVEETGGGVDAIWSYLTQVDLADYANVENVVLLTSAGASIRGTNGANSLNGAGGADQIDGRGGNDTLTGGGGADIFVVRGTGTTIITDFALGSDRIDLSQAGFSSFASLQPFLSARGGNAVIGGLVDGVTTSYELRGVALPNLSAADFIFATGSATPTGWTSAGGDTIGATAGNDSLTGGAGADTIDGLAGDDTINGGTGNDRMIGGRGNDVYVVDATGDVVVENANEGNDTINTSLQTYSLTNLPDIENLTFTGASGANLTGNSGANILTVGSGSNTLTGGSGDDVLVSSGGAGLFDGGSGSDTLQTLGTAVMTAGGTVRLADFTSATLQSIERIQFLGNYLSPLEITLPYSFGKALGFDLQVRGSSGTDRLLFSVREGGTYQIPFPSMSGWTTIVDSGSGRSDLVGLVATSASNYVLKASGEHGHLEMLVGNSGADRLVGGAGPEQLFGGGGNDTIESGIGDDQMTGGAGRDLFILTGSGSGNNKRIEDFTPGQDRIDLTSADIVDYETLIQTADDGNDGVSFHLGNFRLFLTNVWKADLDRSSFIMQADIPAANLTGTARADTLVGTVRGDSLAGAGGNDTLDGGSGNDLLDGGSGSDRMIGGPGDDIYVVDGSGDTVIENVGEGIDLVRTTLSNFSLANLPNVEHLAFVGTGGANLTGNAANNSISGGAGNDTLTGGGGLDTLIGGGGNDVFLFDQGPESGALIDGGAGADTLRIKGRPEISTYGVSVELGDLRSVEKVEFDSPTGNRLEVTVGLEQSVSTGIASVSGGAGADRLVLAVDTPGTYQLPSFALSRWTTTTDAWASDMVVLRATGSGSYVLKASTTHDGIQWLDGGSGSDQLLGSSGLEYLIGREGDDRIDGGAGNDTMTGGSGRDLFVLSGSGAKAITDFTSGQDRIDLRQTGYGSFSDIQALLSTRSGNAILTIRDASLTLEGVSSSDLRAADFIFADSETPRVLTGTSGADVMSGGNAADSLSGDRGNDSLSGGGGNDSLDGGAGNDTMVGGLGDDLYAVDATGDKVIEDANAGLDTIRTTLASYSLATLGAVENLVYGGNAAANLTGNAGANSLVGGSGNDSLTGGGGADTLVGGSGNDLLVQAEAVVAGERFDGGAGSDTLRVSNGQSSDTIFGAARVVDLSAAILTSIERLEFASSSGSATHAVIGFDQMNGVASLSGGTGTDRLVVLTAGAGDYQMSAPALNGWTTGKTAATSDVVLLLGSQSVDYTLRAAASHSGIQWLVGNGGNDRLVGGQDAEQLNGNAGNDTLDGGRGSDTLNGGAGADIFVIGGGAKLIEDFAAGVDRIDLRASGIESFAELQAAMTRSGSNTLITLGGDSVTLQGVAMSSLASADFIYAPAGAARNLTGDAAANQLNGGSGNDVLNGAGGNDTLMGGAGSDTLDGGSGRDRMVGGSGNDRYFVDSSGDSVIEQASEGIDTIVTTLSSYSIASVANVENLIFTGNGAASLTGNGDANVLTGGDANDTLDGGLGNDTLFGGGGRDKLVGGKGQDVLSGNAGADIFSFGRQDAAFVSVGQTDAIADYVDGTDRIFLGTSIGSGSGQVLYAASSVVLGSVSAALDYAQQLLDGHAGNRDVAALNVGGDTYLFYNDAGGSAVNAIIRLQGVDAALLQPSDFLSTAP